MIEDSSPAPAPGPATAASPAAGPPAAAFVSSPAPAPVAPIALVPGSVAVRWLWAGIGVLATLGIVSLVLAWHAEQNGASLERELVRRQQENGVQVAEARGLAKQAQETAGDTAAKVALLEARVAEVSVQRGQLEDLIQSLSRTRDENLLVDIEAATRVAMQQTAITGSAEPLVATLKQADERLARYNQPTLEGVRRAIGRDLDRVRATSVADIGSLGIRIDEAIRMVDDLPMLAEVDANPARDLAAPATNVGRADRTDGPGGVGWRAGLGTTWRGVSEKIWEGVKSLVRVTRIDHPEAMLLAPSQSFFVRENLKLRLLNARLALLSRQFDIAQADLQAAQTALDRYFDRSAKRTQLALQLIRQVAGQSRQVVIPRPDDTLAALTAASAGR